MANSQKLVFSVGTTAGKKTWTVARAKPAGSIIPTDVKSLAQGFLTNATMFNPQPVSFNSAKLVTTTETNINIS